MPWIAHPDRNVVILNPPNDLVAGGCQGDDEDDCEMMPVRSLTDGRVREAAASKKRRRDERASSRDWPKVLFFAHHSEVLDGIEHGLRDIGVELIRIDGSTTPEKR